MTQHVAIKCTYDNGDEGVFVGFNDTCTEDIIKWNIENGRVWCGHKDCECRKYYDRGFKGKRPAHPCMESILLHDWEYGAGWYHTGKRAGTPIHLSNVDKGKIAILTTRFPGDKEEDRRIIGFFKIAHVTINSGKETIMSADKIFRIRLPLDEARDLYFWDYYSTKAGARWNTGLIRYLSDNQVGCMLIDLKASLRDEKVKVMVGNLLNQDFPKILPTLPSGPRIKKSGNRAKRITLKRKYGSTGEGEDHRKLKEWVAQNPEVIGLTNVKRTEVEYVFISGDTADIVFELKENKYAVVEIETFNPAPGCYQALKYRVLKCAELSVDIKSSNVTATLVAWSIPLEVKDFCNKYGIKLFEIKL